MKKILLILLGVLILSSCTSAKNDPADFRVTWRTTSESEPVDGVYYMNGLKGQVQNISDEVQTDITVGAYFSGKNIKNYHMSEIYVDRLEPDGHPLSNRNWEFELTEEQKKDMYDPEDNYSTYKFEFLVEE